MPRQGGAAATTPCPGRCRGSISGLHRAPGPRTGATSTTVGRPSAGRPTPVQEAGVGMLPLRMRRWSRTGGTGLDPAPTGAPVAGPAGVLVRRTPLRRCRRPRRPSPNVAAPGLGPARTTGWPAPTANRAALPAPRSCVPTKPGRPADRRRWPTPGPYGSCRCPARQPT